MSTNPSPDTERGRPNLRITNRSRHGHTGRAGRVHVVDVERLTSLCGTQAYTGLGLDKMLPARGREAFIDCPRCLSALNRTCSTCGHRGRDVTADAVTAWNSLTRTITDTGKTYAPQCDGCREAANAEGIESRGMTR